MCFASFPLIVLIDHSHTLSSSPTVLTKLTSIKTAFL